MKHRLRSVRTYLRLGIGNVIAVAFYRLKVRLGSFEKSLPVLAWSKLGNGALLPSADNYFHEKNHCETLYFNARRFETTSPPSWLLNPYTGKSLHQNDQHWSKFPDFNLEIGDVKTVWELSRFEWLIQECWHIKKTGKTAIPINKWLDNWCETNLMNQGVNWKCPQESSIRAMNLVLARLVVEGTYMSDGDDRYTEFLVAHVERILPTIQYAKAQDNNHGTSEAAALFILGAILSGSTDCEFEKLGCKALKLGRAMLENRISRLVGEDGVFSQYSVTYHRMMLDTLSFVELVRREQHLTEFSSEFYVRAGKATLWLLAMTDQVSGDAPNMGTNDGSMLFNCNSIDFREFRPSCQLAAILFLSENIFEKYEHCLSELFHLRSMKSQKMLNSSSSMQSGYEQQSSGLSSTQRILDDQFALKNGFKRIGSEKSFAILKVPHSRFRPAQADALHIDVWHNGVNLIRDSGTYSYNPPADFKSHLGDTSFHSTIEIDGRNQMPKVSRFLYSNWLTEIEESVSSSDVGSEFSVISGAYIDYAGASHRRQVSYVDGCFSIEDTVSGCEQGAVMSFRLPPCIWVQEGNSVRSDFAVLEVNGDGIIDASLDNSVESRYYLQLDEIPVFKVSLSKEARTITTMHLLS